MRVLVTGVAGLIGSHLAEALVERGDDVVGLDNFLTGQRSNLAGLSQSSQRFSLVERDVSDAVAPEVVAQLGSIDAVCHLASPASPLDFADMPLEILRAGSSGTFAVMELARLLGARVLFASTSEVYGEPLVHPQPETYLGNVSTTGPRACYDESKRFGEAVVSTYRRSFGLSTAIVRIFNTYGPRMRVDDGRVVSNFIIQALSGHPLTIHGDGSQTRSFCFVDDQVRGLLALLDSEHPGPINIGSSQELSVQELAERVIELTGAGSQITYLPLPEDDPTQRRPDLTSASELLGWEPTTPLVAGLERTIAYFTELLRISSVVPAPGPE